MKASDYKKSAKGHYQSIWGAAVRDLRCEEGPMHELPPEFAVLEFPPHGKRAAWAYATACMSLPGEESAIEIHLLSPLRDELHVELLTAIVHYHRTASRLGLGHTVNFGRPWMNGSKCSFGLISRPYLDGPKLELLEIGADIEPVRCLWLLPITEQEREFKRSNGLDALERLFEKSQFNYLEPGRPSVV